MSYREELRRLVESRIGVRIQLRADDPILRFVEDRVRELALPGPSAYLERVARGSAEDHEVRLLVRVVTNGQTYFFREDEQIKALADHLATLSRGRPVEVWCAGCATGEEAYSLVIACLERRIDVRVLATDVNDQRLDHARRALYDDLSLRHAPRDVLARYFDREGDAWRVRNAVRSRVEIAYHNVVSDELPALAGRETTFDAVLCRNLFIYFARERVEKIVATLSRVLARDGLLCLGTAESLHGHDVPLVSTPLGVRTAYRHASMDTGMVDVTPRIRAAARSEDSSPSPPWIEVPKDSRAASEVDRVVEVLRSGSAEDAHTRLRALDPARERWELWVSLGNACLRAHAVDEAVTFYGVASAAAALEAEPSFFLGIAELKRGQVERAREALRRVVFLEPSHWRASLLLAGALERSGDPTAAARELAHARSCLVSGTPHPSFRSITDGIPAATVSQDEARLAIDVRLAALERARTAEVSRE